MFVLGTHIISLFPFLISLNLFLCIWRNVCFIPPEGFVLGNIPVRCSGGPTPSEHIQRSLLGAVRELWPAFMGGARVQIDNQSQLSQVGGGDGQACGHAYNSSHSLGQNKSISKRNLMSLTPYTFKTMRFTKVLVCSVLSSEPSLRTQSF